VVQQVSSDSRGILDPVGHQASVDHRRYEPSPPVGRFVTWYWAIEWHLGDGTHRPEVLVHPVVNLVFSPDEATVTGIMRRRDTRVLAGSSWVLGAMFRPAGFRPLVDGPLSRLTDRRQQADAVLGPDTPALHDKVATASTWDDRVQLIDAFLADRLPREPQPSEDTTAIVERIIADRSLLRVDQVAAEFDLSVRALQRRFADHVGVSPKWVIQRYRLFEAVEAAAKGDDVDWATLAADLGYSDQAHLVRSFTRAVGMPPDRYARSVRRPSFHPHKPA
jgi:AraC-like DNA-binding protein